MRDSNQSQIWSKPRHNEKDRQQRMAPSRDGFSPVLTSAPCQPGMQIFWLTADRTQAAACSVTTPHRPHTNTSSGISQSSSWLFLCLAHRWMPHVWTNGCNTVNWLLEDGGVMVKQVCLGSPKDIRTEPLSVTHPCEPVCWTGIRGWCSCERSKLLAGFLKNTTKCRRNSKISSKQTPALKKSFLFSSKYYKTTMNSHLFYIMIIVRHFY